MSSKYRANSPRMHALASVLAHDHVKAFLANKKFLECRAEADGLATEKLVRMIAGASYEMGAITMYGLLEMSDKELDETVGDYIQASLAKYLEPILEEAYKAVMKGKEKNDGDE